MEFGDGTVGLIFKTERKDLRALFMKILYCNFTPKEVTKGHIAFDVKWVNLLDQIADVTLLAPTEKWYQIYEKINPTVKVKICDVGEKIKRKKFYNLKIWNQGKLKSLSVQNHKESAEYINFVIKLDKKEHFDYIVVSTLDAIQYVFMRHRIKKESRVFLIEHQCQIWNHYILKYFFKRFKDRIHHIVMEADGVDYLRNQYGIPQGHIHYIPHMLNSIEKMDISKTNYTVVGISNSNNDTEIQKIVDLEMDECFFTKNNIKALFRSKTIEYENRYLKVFSGRLGLTYEEYYSYVTNAKIIVLPFGEGFGIRSSGTLQDAFSQKKPVVGSAFDTLLQYNRMMPHTCIVYKNMNDLKEKILSILENVYNDNNIHWEKEYNWFIKEHDNSTIVQCLKESFV